MADQPIYKAIEKVQNIDDVTSSIDATKALAQGEIEALKGENPANGDFQRLYDQTSAKRPREVLDQPLSNDGLTELAKTGPANDPQNPLNADFQRVMNQTLIENPSSKTAPKKTLPEDSLITQVNRSENQYPVENLSNSGAGSKIQEIRQQIQSSLQSIGDVKERLANPSLGKLPNAYKTPLRNRLRSFGQNVDILSNTRVGRLNRSVSKPLIEEMDSFEKLPKPVQKFFTLLTDGQSKLEVLDKELSVMGDQELTHKDILSIQLKMGRISHELELFSSLLNKAIESTKTIMNVQV